MALGIVDALAEAGVADVTDDAVLAGLAGARWPGRLEVLERDGLTIVLDGAHNPDGAAALASTLNELAPHLPPGRATLLLAVMADKAVADILAALAAAAPLREAHCLATRVPDSERSLSAADLAAAWDTAVAEAGAGRPAARRPAAGRSGAGRSAASPVDDADEALRNALEVAASAGGPLVVSGSLYLVGHVRARLVPDGG